MSEGMCKWRILLFGSIGVAAEALEWLLTRNEFDVIGVVCGDKPLAEWRRILRDRDVRETAEKFNIPVYQLDDVCELKPDVGLSVRYHEILRPHHLRAFSKGVINLHGAPLPEMRGSLCDVMALIEGRSEFGASLHWMDTGIDTGDVLVVRRFPIEPDDTVYDLFTKSNQVGLEMIKDHLLQILSGEILGVPQSDLPGAEESRTYRKSEVIRLKCLDLSTGVSALELWNRVRAFAFPGHEPAYVQTPFGRVYLTLGRNEPPNSSGLG